jgi:hypothetical protein
MSKAAKPAERKQPARETETFSARPAPVFKPPLKPRRGLFYAMLGFVGVWVTTLLLLYFTTVFPHRNERPHHQRVEPTNTGMTVPR